MNFEQLSRCERINVVGTAVFLIPFSIFGLWVSWPSVHNSWVIREISPDPGGLPRYPIKAVILLAFAAISFVTPLFAVVLAIIVLKELVGPRRWRSGSDSPQPPP